MKTPHITLSAIVGVLVGVASAYSATPHVSATWGGDRVELVEIKTGKAWSQSYDEFFQKCGKHKPSEVGVKVFGRLPSWYKGKGSVPPRGAKPRPMVATAAPVVKKTSRSQAAAPDLPTHLDTSDSGNSLLPPLTEVKASLLDAYRYLVKGEPPPEATVGERHEIVPESGRTAEAEESTLPDGMTSLAPEQDVLTERFSFDDLKASDRVLHTINGVKVYSLLQDDLAPEEAAPQVVAGQFASQPVQIGPAYNIRRPAVITAYALDAMLGGVLKGLGEDIIRESRKNGICPLFLAGVAMHESDNGRSQMVRTKQNAFGLYREGKGFLAFGSVKESVVEAARRLGGRTYAKCQTIQQIHRIYCPIGAANDPKNLNRHWSDGVTHHMRSFLGPVVHVASL